MLCKDCPMQVINGNESVYPSEETCWYGEKYTDEHCVYFEKYDEWGCRKHKKTIERDFCPPELRDWLESDKRKEEYLGKWVKPDNLPIDKVRS